MKIHINISVEEVKKLVADHLAKMIGMPISPDDITTGSSYDHSYSLGDKYDGFEYPPKPKKPVEPVPPEPKKIEDETQAAEKAPF